MRASTALAIALAVAALLGPAAAGVPGSVPVAAAQESPDGYVVEQADECHPIEPLERDQTVAEFYEYRSHDTHDGNVSVNYSSHGTTDLQETDVSTMFLYEGPEGTSLVVIHDELAEDTTGGRATLEIVGLPADAGWVVRDDSYGLALDTFERGNGWSRASWRWDTGRTDGGVIRGLGGSFELTVHPSFNDDADIDDDPDDDREESDVTEWHALSDGNDSDAGTVTDGNHTRVRLPSLSEPAIVRSGTCEDPTITYERSDSSILATVEDPGDEQVAVRPPAETLGGDVRYERLLLTGDGGEVELATADEPDPVVDNERRVVMPSVRIDDRDFDARNGTVRFTLDERVFEEYGGGPGDVTLYAGDGGEWSPIEPDYMGYAGGRHEFRGEVDGSGQYAAGIARSAVTVESASVAEETVDEGEPVNVTATVDNPGDAAGETTVDLHVWGPELDGAHVDRTTVTVGPRSNETVTFTQRFDRPGEYVLMAGGQNQTVTVRESEDPADDGDWTSWSSLALGGLLVFLVTGASAYVVVGGRR